MTDQIENYLLIAFGIYVILGRHWQIKQYIRWQRDNFNYRFTPQTIKFCEIMAIIVGSIFIILGVLGLLDIMTTQA